jgi:hypothetical protein
MKKFKIDHEVALKILKQWQEGNRKVEARLRYSEGLIQSYSGYVTVEPEGQVVIAHVADSDNCARYCPRSGEQASLGNVRLQPRLVLTPKWRSIAALTASSDRQELCRTGRDQRRGNFAFGRLIPPLGCPLARILPIYTTWTPTIRQMEVAS